MCTFKKGEKTMIWEISTLLLGIISALYAFPYGKWEFKNKNKAGGISVYITAALCIIISSIQLII